MWLSSKNAYLKFIWLEDYQVFLLNLFEMHSEYFQVCGVKLYVRGGKLEFSTHGLINFCVNLMLGLK